MRMLHLTIVFSGETLTYHRLCPSKTLDILRLVSELVMKIQKDIETTIFTRDLLDKHLLNLEFYAQTHDTHQKHRAKCILQIDDSSVSCTIDAFKSSSMISVLNRGVINPIPTSNVINSYNGNQVIYTRNEIMKLRINKAQYIKQINGMIYELYT